VLFVIVLCTALFVIVLYTMLFVIVLYTVLFVIVLYRRERVLHADNLSASTNVYLLRGVIELGRLLASAPKDISSTCMSATDVWHSYVCYCCFVSLMLN